MCFCRPEMLIMIDSIFVLTVVHIHDFHIFTAIIHHLEGLFQLLAGLLAQLVERRTDVAKVMGSNPV